MSDRITEHGRAWEISRTWWLLLLTVFWLGWISFVYMGLKTKTRKWLFEGIGYCVIFNLGLMLSKNSLFIVLFFIGWIVSIIRFALEKKEYLLRRSTVESLTNVTDAELKRKIQSEYKPNDPITEATQKINDLLGPNINRLINSPTVPGFKLDNNTTIAQSTVTNPVESKPIAQPQNTSNVKPQSSNPAPNSKASAEPNPYAGVIIDINNCGEEALASLPGISVAMAKKAITHREDIGGYDNLDSFYQYLDLKPHMIYQIGSHVKCGAPQGTAKQTGRILDF